MIKVHKPGEKWEPIEKLVSVSPVWILKYDMWHKDGNFVDPFTPGAEKFTSCHGWYSSESDALAVRRHMHNPNAYSIEKVHRRILK